jgi:ubiquinone/menaquinone biosynthesis C-methylase UbiE
VSIVAEIGAVRIDSMGNGHYEKPVEEVGSGDIEATLLDLHLGSEASTRKLITASGLGTGATVLDLGCGMGGAMRTCRDAGWRMVGLEPSWNLLEAGSSLLGDGFGLVRGFGERLPFRSSSLEGVMMLHVSMNLIDKGAVVQEIARVLKPGGKLLFYEVFKKPENRGGEYPLPWSSSSEFDFSVQFEEFYELLQTRFTEEVRQEETDWNLGGLRKRRELGKKLALHRLQGDDVAEEMLANLERGLGSVFEVWLGIWRKK